MKYKERSDIPKIIDYFEGYDKPYSIMLRLDKELKPLLTSKARVEDTSINNIINKIIREYLGIR